MRIQLYQADLFWENPAKNRIKLKKLIDSNAIDTDLLILPEMFTTGFSMNASSLAEPMDGPSVNWMQEIAQKANTAVCGSIIIKYDGNYYNRFVFAFSDGSIEYYDKKHLFTLAGEHQTYTAGRETVVFSWRDWQICPQVCYDLRFPESVRTAHPYQLLIYVASWPDKRIDAWDCLLRARAIENQCYVAGVNRVGQDGSLLNYSGHSAVYGPDGSTLAFNIGEETVLNAELDKKWLKEFRNSLPFLMDSEVITFD